MAFEELPIETEKSSTEKKMEALINDKKRLVEYVHFAKKLLDCSMKKSGNNEEPRSRNIFPLILKMLDADIDINKNNISDVASDLESQKEPEINIALSNKLKFKVAGELLFPIEANTENNKLPEEKHTEPQEQVKIKKDNDSRYKEMSKTHFPNGRTSHAEYSHPERNKDE